LPAVFWSLTPRELEYLRQHREIELKRESDLAKLAGWVGGLSYAMLKAGKGAELHRDLFPPIFEDDETGERREANKLDSWKAAVKEFRLKGIPGPWDVPGWTVEEAWGDFL